ncbi:MAG: molecular chaperone DnaJ [Oscillospiraceae bacterium]|nr:molecular chaperone DnaJ [Oscillospiraceae bacterium]
MAKDFYEVLGVGRDASDDDIKKAYRKLAKENHPDLNPGDKQREARFKEISAAYETLSDGDKRARYDRFGPDGVDPGMYGGYGGGGFDDFDLSSFVSSIFGGFGGQTQRRTGPSRGENLRASLSLSFEEAVFGCAKEITVSRIEACDSCRGSGAADGTRPETCQTCGGSGQVRSVRRTPLGSIATATPCQTCGGKGKTIKTPCQTCKGAGIERRKVAISVNIPAGIDDGQTMPIRGQGSAGANGGPAGDVLVTVRVSKHALFTRDGTSIHCEMPVTFGQAALGAELEVPTLDGKVKYTMPPGTQNGAVFRLRNKGVPALGSKQRGDQFVHIMAEVPSGLNKKQKQLLSEFEEISKDQHPRCKSFRDKWK